MEVKDGMSRIVLTIGPAHTLRQAATKMTERGVGAAIVIDESLPGPAIISEGDLLTSVGNGQDPDAETVGDHMSGRVISAAPDWSLEKAAAEMARRSIRHLLVVDGGEPVGMLSMRDIMGVWSTEGATSGMAPK